WVSVNLGIHTFIRFTSRVCLGTRGRGHSEMTRILTSGLGYVQSNIRDQIQQDNAYLVNRYPRVVKHVKLLHRKMKPTAVKAIHPIVSQHKEQKPDYQNSIIDYCTPQKRAAHRFDIHDSPPDLRRGTTWP